MKFQEILRPGLALFAISFAAAGILGALNMATKDVIAENIARDKKAALSEVARKAGGWSDETAVDNAYPVKSYYLGHDESGWVVVVLAEAKGYSGGFDVMTGITQSGEITGIAIGDNEETPGLGKEAEKPKFKNQFNGLTTDAVLSVKKDDARGAIDAITSATITSRAVTNAVKAAAEWVSKADGAQFDGGVQ